MFSRFFMVVFCMLAALMIATAVTLQMAPRHVDSARDWAATNYQNHLHDHVEGIGQHAQAAGAWAHDQYQHHLGGHFNTAGQWVADTYQEHASEHVNAAGNWVHGTYQQHLKPHLDPVHQWASNAYDEHLAHHVNKIHSYFTGGPQHDQILNPYDCSGDWSSWSDAHQEWCCEHHDTGCTAKVTTPPQKHYMWISVPVHPGKYDCAAGIQKWQEGWSHGKKKWCCSNKGIGCQEGDGFDCTAGNSDIGWSSRKKLWCCLHENRGCAKEQVDVFDCEAGYANWPESWSGSKKEWCCDHHHRGCHGEGMEHFDCRKDLEDWHTLWTGPKQAFCCKTYALGCPTHAAVPATPDVVPATPDVVPVTPDAVPVRETIHVVDLPAYDCTAGFANWRAGWSEGKKLWCCQHYSKGCA